ncbi:MAG: hypothetical protein OXH52_19030 [Gammaproteobacteria bacterium]|nr:hypothetical protein [Gammaproteobacteria bacterium]
MRAAIVGLGILALAAAASAQPSTLAHGIPSLDAGSSLQLVPTHPVPGVDAAALTAAALRDTGPGPERYALPVETSITPFGDVGLVEERWDEELGQVRATWRLRVASEGAVSMELGFHTYWMPPGGELFVYTPDYEEVLSFSEIDNAEHGELWTPLLPGGEIVIEVSAPADELSRVRLQLNTVLRGFRRFDAVPFSNSSCTFHVACNEASRFRNAVRAVGRVSIGGYWCSGVLLNNTRQDRRAYFLTGDHCGAPSGGAGARWQGAFRPAALKVAWNYQDATCGGGWTRHPDFREQTGAYLRARSADTDFALFELDSRPESSANVHWAGWSRNPSLFRVTAGIHHPRGRSKIISRDDDAPEGATITGFSGEGDARFRACDDSANCDALTVYWDEGFTHRGSSGSPLFNGWQRVIGQLIGGHHSCGRVGSRDDSHLALYGRLRASWTGNGTRSTRLRDWLDPRRTNPNSFGGVDADVSGYNLVVRSARVSASRVTAGESFTFSATVHNLGPGTSPTTRLRYYHRPPGGSWTRFGSDSVPGLRRSASSPESIIPAAPTAPGRHLYGACVLTQRGEIDDDDNCGSSVAVTVVASDAARPDLVVRSTSISDSTPVAGQQNRLYATVRNIGRGTSSEWQLVWYHKHGTGSWESIGRDYGRALRPGAGSRQSFLATTPSSSGTHHYAACVNSVATESDTRNNCGSVVEATVGAGDATRCTNNLGTVSGTVTRTGAWTGECLTVHYSLGEPAVYYTFTLRNNATVTIDLTSSNANAWLALYGGSGHGSGRITADNDGGEGTNARIVRSMAAGTYTIEATTLAGGERGSYRLTLAVGAGGGTFVATSGVMAAATRDAREHFGDLDSAYANPREELEWTRSGSTVSGRLSLYGLIRGGSYDASLGGYLGSAGFSGFTATVSGTITTSSGGGCPCTVRLSGSSGRASYSLNGTLDAAGNRITGQVEIRHPTDFFPVQRGSSTYVRR